MKIENIEVFVVPLPLEKQCADSTWTIETLGYTIVRLSTDDGLTGIGWTYDVGGEAIRKLIEKEFSRVLIGKTPLETEVIWQEIFHLERGIGRKGLVFCALSIIDIALWDLKGKIVGLPLYKLLGGNQRKVPLYGSGGWTSYSEKELIEEMLMMVESGYSKVKMKVGVDFGQNPKEDERRVRAVRKALGDSVDLMIDANNVWTRATAIPFAHHLADCRLFWFEEPVLADDIEGLAKIASQIQIPVASGEHEYTKYGAKELLTKQAADIIQMDVTKCGGITELLKVAALTQAWNVPLAPHAMPYAHMHLVSAVPNAFILEDLLIQKHADETFFIDPPQPRDGFLEIPDTPGLGLELNEKNLHKYNIR